MSNKAVIYVRVSSKEQEESGFSIPAQRKLLQSYALENGLRIVAQFEEAETAKTAGRSAFNKMLKFLRGTPDVTNVLVEKTDRLYRNFKDYSEVDFETMGLKIHLVKEGEILHGESKSHQKFIHGVKVLMAKNYSDNLSEEVRKGQLQKAEEGEWPNMAPIGYRNRLEDHTIVPDPHTAPLIRLAFELMASGGYSLAKLKRHLFQKGLCTQRTKSELGKSAIQRVLSNPIYYGDFVWGGEYFRGKHTPIIDKTLYDRVQHLMKAKGKSKLVKRDFAFTSLLTCSVCGCAITAEEHHKKSGKVYVYYRCTNGRGLCKKVIYLPENKLEAQLRQAIDNIQIPAEVVQMTRAALLQSSKKEQEAHTAALAKLNSRYTRIQTLLGAAYEDKLEGTIDTDLWETKTAEWKREQADIQTNIAALKSADTSYMLEGIRLLELAERAADLFPSMNNDDKRQLLKTVLLNPRLNGTTLEYEYKKPFSMFEKGIEIEKWRDGRD
jgi:site-specific DNA recombinase